MGPNEILRAMELERFNEVLSASPRKFREELFRRTGIKGKKKSAFSKSNKADDRVKKLLESLQNGADITEEVTEEVIRNYLYTKRTLLADALDHLEVPHEEGLTDADLEFIAELDADKKQALEDYLAGKEHAPTDINLYLQYMNITAE